MSGQGGQESQQSFQGIRKLIYELNVLRRHVGTYPQGHPVVMQTLARVHSYLDTLTQSSDRLVLGFSKDSILFGEETIDLKDPVLHDFARSLFAHGILAVTVERGTSPDELLRFNECLMTLRQGAVGDGGVSELWHAAGLEHIHVDVIDYRALAGSADLHEADAGPISDFWTGFVRGVLAGSIVGISRDAGDDAEMMEAALPEVLAEILREQEESPVGLKLPVILKLLTQFLRQVDERHMTADPHAVSKFIRFLDALKPEVREYFLQGSFNALSDRPAVSERILEQFSGGMLVEALNKGLKSGTYAPPSILDILRKLVLERNLPGAGGSAEGSALQEALPVQDPVKEKMSILLREEDSRQFVPEEYQKALHTMTAAGELLPSDDPAVQALRKTLLEHDVDVSYSHIIVELLDIPSSGEDDAALRQNLLDLCGYFVRMGDFSALASICERLQRLEHSGDHKQTLLSAFTLPDFVDEVLRGPVIWGKQKFEDIALLIRCIGEPFLNPMLDRLADEQNLSLRRFYVDRVVEYGPAAIAPVGARLLDSRWYFVRNLVVILRSIGNESARTFLKTLQSHGHPKVRQEVQRALFQFRDDGAYAMLAADIESPDPEARLAAIRLSVKHHTPLIVLKLGALLESEGLADEAIETKGEALRALGAIGDTSCLPGVEKVLRSRNFFRQIALNRLKEELVRALGTFRSSAARELLQRVRSFGSKDLIRVAEEMLHAGEVRHGN